MSGAPSAYDRDYALSRSTPQDSWLFDVIVSHLAPRPGWRILDVGCNTGELVARLATLGCEPLGIDLSPAAIELARARHTGLDYRVCDLDQLNEPAFDAVVASHVIEHVPEPSRFLRAAGERLSGDGRLVLATPNRWAWVHKGCHALRGLPLFHDPTHVHLFSPPELKRIVSRAGFASVRYRTYEFYFPFATHLPRTVRMRIPGLCMGDHLVVEGRRDSGAANRGAAGSTVQ